MSARRRLLVIEDDPRMQQLLPMVLGSDHELTAASSASEALSHLAAHGADLVLVDLGLPDQDGVALIELLAQRHPGLPLLVLTVATARARVLAALRAGACGYLLKEDLGTRLAQAVEEAIQGGMPMSPGAARYVLEQMRQSAPQPSAEPLTHLTDREREVLRLLSQGLTYAELGHTLGISINTVRAHVRAVYEKLHASNKAEAVMIAVREGWLRD